MKTAAERKRAQRVRQDGGINQSATAELLNQKLLSTFRRAAEIASGRTNISEEVTIRTVIYSICQQFPEAERNHIEAYLGWRDKSRLATAHRNHLKQTKA